MQVLHSEDIKRINKTIIRKVLLELGSATRKELSLKSGISNAAIGTFLSEMLEANEIVETYDESSGGRCPSRFSLYKDNYHILCGQIDHQDLIFKIFNTESKVLSDDKIHFTTSQDLVDRLDTLCEEFQIKAISISTAGIIQEDVLLHGTGLHKSDLIKCMKEHFDFPVQFENDVKCMLKGYHNLHRENCADIAYIYLTENGMGSACMTNYEVIQGKDGMAGELGMLKYEDKTLNQWCSDISIGMDAGRVLAQFVMIFVCCMNPEVIVLTGANVTEQVKMDVINRTADFVKHRFTVNIEIDDDHEASIWKALWQSAMDSLMH